MSGIEDKKQQRSTAKRAVTMAARRLTGSINRDVDMDILKCLMVDLEKAYDDFCALNEEYEALVMEECNAEHRIVNGEDIATYRMNVCLTYKEARREFIEEKTVSLKRVEDKETGPIKVIISRNHIKLRELMLDIELNLYSENPDLYTLQADKDDIEPIMDVIGDNMAKLSSFKALEQMSEHQMQVDSVIGSAYKLKRETKQRLRGLSTSQESVVSVVTPLTSSVSYVVSSTAATSVSMGITSDSTPVSSTQTQPT